MKKSHLIVLGFILLNADLLAQNVHTSIFAEDVVQPRMRVIIDNDFGGDPDGLFQLVQHLLSPSVEIRGIIGSHLRAGDGWDPSKESATHAKQKAEEVLRIMHLSNAYPVYQG